MIKILIISYHFPPDAAIGGVRPYQFARLFPVHDIEPWVLTVSPEYAERWDMSMVVEGIPEERIRCTSVGLSRMDHIYRLLLPLYKIAKWRKGISNSTSNKSASDTSPDDVHKSDRDWFHKTPGRRRLLTWLLYPDYRIGWYKPAIQAANEMIAENRFDAILSTSPPLVTHLIAHKLSCNYGIPWIMDLRDPWYGDWSKESDNSFLLKYLFNRLFNKCAARATKIILNTERLHKYVDIKNKNITQKTVAIPNGYMFNQQLIQNNDITSFSISHYGNIYGKRNPYIFFQGYQMWQSTYHKAELNNEIRFYGEFEDNHPNKCFPDLNKSININIIPSIPKENVPLRMSEDYVLLLIANNQPLQIPGKAYEYLASGKRILAITENQGATADLLRDIPGCIIAESPEQVSQALERFYSEYKRGELSIIDRSKYLNNLNYECRTADMARVLKEVCAQYRRDN